MIIGISHVQCLDNYSLLHCLGFNFVRAFLLPHFNQDCSSKANGKARLIQILSHCCLVICLFKKLLISLSS